MFLLILSSVVVPVLALVVFILFRAAGGEEGVWAILAAASLDLCSLSLGIAGATFPNIKLESPYLAILLLIEVIIGISVTLINKRGPQLGLISDWKRGTLALTLGVVAVTFPACILAMFGRVG